MLDQGVCGQVLQSFVLLRHRCCARTSKELGRWNEWI
jgi:hypothetical protein